MSVLGALRRMFARPSGRPSWSNATVRGRYDAAQETDTLSRHWATADALDADSCNTLAVRKKLRERARLELANNAYCKGIVSTHANYVIGTGPRLRMQTQSTGFNRLVESDWKAWCNRIGFAHKLRLLFLAKVGDGEAIAELFTNPAIADGGAQLDLSLIECDRLTASYLTLGAENYIDGITFDSVGNPVFYDILKQHPGSTSAWSFTGSDYRTIPAEFIVHWFRAERPGQHRGVPEITASLNLFGQSRRHREAVLSAAEWAASMAGVLEMDIPASSEADEAVPFSTIPMEKGVMVASPAGAKLKQITPEQPSTTHADFMRTIVAESARPLNMPYNIAACDSSTENFSGGRLNRHTYFISVEVERQLAEFHAVDPIFRAWFREQSTLYRAGEIGNELPEPKHAWDWPGMPTIDETKTANARKTSLACGSTRLGLLYSEDGLDFEDELPAMAAEYGITDDEMRARLLQCNLPEKPKQVAPVSPAENGDTPTPERKQNQPANARNGSGRFPIHS